MTNEEILNTIKLKYPNAEFFGNKIILGKITRYFELPVVANRTEGKLLIENTIPIGKCIFDDGFPKNIVADFFDEDMELAEGVDTAILGVNYEIINNKLLKE